MTRQWRVLVLDGEWMQDISLLNLLELSETTMIRLARLIQEDPIMARLKLKIGVYKDELSFMEQKFH